MGGYCTSSPSLQVFFFTEPEHCYSSNLRCVFEAGIAWRTQFGSSPVKWLKWVVAHHLVQWNWVRFYTYPSCRTDLSSNPSRQGVWPHIHSSCQGVSIHKGRCASRICIYPLVTVASMLHGCKFLPVCQRIEMLHKFHFNMQIAFHTLMLVQYSD